ncbi:carbohydrate ABC transporter permease [Radiobacillus sp. PE A8.2]|uniref:carbohydrate ABC transporter permease n=1 Tax=Radiobacillus sp. PE A8.2 TaxID=3380349 RepID=UPI00388E3A6F
MNQVVRKMFIAYIFLLPAVLTLGIIKYFPFAQGVYKSLFSWNGANVDKFIGLDNYIELFQDPVFLTSLLNIVIITISYLIGQIIFPLTAAIGVFHLPKKIQSVYKTLFIVPMIVPLIIIFLLWRWIYMGDYGVINELLNVIGLENWARDWLGNSETALWSIVFVNFPWIGTIAFLIFLAGLIAISPELYEAGRIDGMGVWQRIRYIELPLIKNQIRLVVILSVITPFQSFENILILTQGGPGYRTMTPAYYLYKSGFEYNQLGYASAIGVVVFVILITFTILANKFIKPSERLD